MNTPRAFGKAILLSSISGLLGSTGIAQAELLGVRPNFAAGVMESYSIDPDTAAATFLDDFSISGGWGDGMFAVDIPGNTFYITTDPSGSVPADLYTIDLTTGAWQSTQALGGAAPARIDAMAVLSDGSILGLRLGAALIESYSINPVTAAATLLDSFSIAGGWGSGMFAVDESAGVFYVATDPSGSGPANFYTASLSTGALQNTQALGGASPVRLDSIEVLSDGSVLGLRPDYGAGVMESYSVNPATVVATALPTSTFALSGGWGPNMFAVNEGSDDFYIVTDPSGSPPADLYTVGLTSGALDGVDPLGGAAPTRIDAMAYIPEPGALALLLAGVCGLPKRRRR